LKSKWLKILNFFVFLSITVFLVYLVFKDIPLDKFYKGLLRVNYLYIFISGVSGLIAFYFRALRWQLMLKPFGYNPRVWNVFHSVSFGYFANMALPRMGEVARCGTIKKTDKVEFEQAFGTVVTERMSDLVVLFLLVIFVFVWKANFFGTFIKKEIFLPLGSKIGYSALWLWFICSVIVFTAIFWFFAKKFPENIVIKKLIKVLKGFKDGLFSIYRMDDKWLFIFYTFIIWLLYWLMAYIVFFAMDATKGLSPVDGIFVLVAGSFGMVAPVQSGFGAYHWIVSRALMIYGISKANALLYATLIHETQTLMVIIMGIISSYWLFVKKGYLKKQ